MENSRKFIKPYILSSIFYSQTKIEILRCSMLHMIRWGSGVGQLASDTEDCAPLITNSTYFGLLVKGSGAGSNLIKFIINTIYIYGI